MKAIKYIALSFAVALGASTVNAHDFTANIEGQTLYFKIVNKSKRAVEVTYEGNRADKKSSDIVGSVSIPDKVRFGKEIYTVEGIDAKAFCGAENLEAVVLPYTVDRIGSFAFEGCTSLSKIVFPGRPVKFGEGCFFGCKSISDISLGSDWTSIELSAFRWSDSLQVINIPAKVEKIRGLKSLRWLKDVSVDANNERFASKDGVLYNKEMTTLYAVPRDYEGVLNVAPGTESIAEGALIDCSKITSIIFPASLKSFSFRETSRMKDLASITFEGEETPLTAIADGNLVFLLQVANPNVTIFVPKAAKKNYASSLVTTPGEYFVIDTENSIPYAVGANEMPSVKKIKVAK